MCRGGLGFRPCAPQGVRVIDASELVAGLRRGDEDAVRYLVDTYYDPILRYLFRVLQDRQWAEDACQEAFVRALQRIGQLQDARGLKAWLYRIASNTARDHLRRRPDWVPVAEPAALAEEADAHGGDAVRDRVYVAALLKTLSPEHREVLVLRFYEDMSLPAIAEILGIPVGTVKSRLHHALRQLRRLVEREEQEVAERGLAQCRPRPSHVG